MSDKIQEYVQVYGQSIGQRVLDGAAQVYGTSGTTFTISDQLPQQLTIGSDADGHPLVTVNLKTGETTFGPNYEPRKAARSFWDAVVGARPK